MILWDLPPAYMYVVLFVLGTITGSFLNVCVHRFPRQESVLGAWRHVLHPPSMCPFCRTSIAARDNIPILGWLLLRGRCRTCRHRIPLRYPAVELLNGLLFIGLYWAMVPIDFADTVQHSCVYSPLGPWAAWQYRSHRAASYWLHLQYLYFLVLVEALLVASLIDLDLRIIPDSVTLPAMTVGILGSLTGRFWLVPVWFQSASWMNMLWTFLGNRPPAPAWWTASTPAWTQHWPMAHGLSVSLAGVLVGGGIIWFVRIAGGWVFRREAMGFGDVVLMATIGSFLGWQATVLVFFLAPVCALAIVAVGLLANTVRYLLGYASTVVRPREIPFGPFLSMAAVWVLVSWKSMAAATSSFFGLGPLVPAIAVLMGGTLVAVLWAVQGVKWMLGIPLDEPLTEGEWTSADQLAFFANKDLTDGVGPLHRAEWPGVAAGRGEHGRRLWRGS
uniref:Prepilin peptidase n=1 Tax=Schlesneria paludicola TaxID=360056 RepID=A0A7C4QS52_9PLAN